MRPVMRGLVSYSALKDCSVDVEDLARMNDAIDVWDENARRLEAK